MTNPSTDKQWRITAKIDTALCIGDSGASETGADRATIKGSDDKLYIPASTFKGIWRHACEVIAQSEGHFVCESPRAENMCPPHQEVGNEPKQDRYCIICQIFGSPKTSSRIFINNLIADMELVAGSTEIRNGVTINRRRHVAEEHRLYFTETSLSNADIIFSGDVTIDRKVTDTQIRLLRAGLKYIHAIGTGKSRGLGWLKIEQTDPSPVVQNTTPIVKEADDFTELAIEVTLKSPIVPGGRKPTGQTIQSVQHIAGGLLRGAVADRWLADSEDGEPDDDFRNVFLSSDAGIFRNCYPGASVLPATAIGCKDFAGFPGADDKDKHDIFDTLLERLVAEEANMIYNPSCPHCNDNGRVEAQRGFYTQSDEGYQERTLNTRLLTRVAINRQRKVAADELLYNLNAIDPLSVKGEKISLYGSALIPSALVSKVADTLQKQVQRLGGGSSRGLGRVCVKVKRRNDTDPLEQRISDFNAALQRKWETYSGLPCVNIATFDRTYFSIALQSDAILQENWQSSMILTAKMLQEMTGCTAEVTPIRSFASYDYVSGWNAAWRLPKRTDLITRIGSVFVFHVADIDTWIPALKTLEKIGVGNRREEGFGQILICDQFHLRTREKVKLKTEGG